MNRDATERVVRDHLPPPDGDLLGWLMLDQQMIRRGGSSGADLLEARPRDGRGMIYTRELADVGISPDRCGGVAYRLMHDGP